MSDLVKIMFRGVRSEKLYFTCTVVFAVPIALGILITLSCLIFFAPLWAPTSIAGDWSFVTYFLCYGVLFLLVSIFVGWAAWGDRFFSGGDYSDVMWISALVQLVFILALHEIFY